MKHVQIRSLLEQFQLYPAYDIGRQNWLSTHALVLILLSLDSTPALLDAVAAVFEV